MKLEKSTAIKCKNDVIYREMGGIIYILDPKTATIRTLNESASFLWKALKKPLTLHDLTDLVCREYEVSEKTAKNDTEEFVSRYLEQGFLQTIDKPV